MPASFSKKRGGFVILLTLVAFLGAVAIVDAANRPAIGPTNATNPPADETQPAENQFSTQLDALVGTAIALFNAPVCQPGQALTKNAPYSFSCVSTGAPVLNVPSNGLKP